MYTVFCDSLKYGELVSLKQCGHLQPTFLLYLDKLCATGESLIVTNKMALRPKYSRLCSSRPALRCCTTTPLDLQLPGCCGPNISHDIIIYFHLLHNQGGRFKIVSTIGHVLCVLLFKKGFMPSMLIVILIFLGSMVNSGFCESMFRHGVASTRCLIILASCLCFSLCHRNNSNSLFANQCFK
jgi:uncharacterized membrane protein